MRVGVIALFRLRDAHLREAFQNLLLHSLTGSIAVMNPYDLGDLFADGNQRIQRRHRILKDHCNLLSANFPQFLHRELRQILALKHGSAVLDDCRVRKELEESHIGDALAGTGFADNADNLPSANLKGHTADCLDLTV